MKRTMLAELITGKCFSTMYSLSPGQLQLQLAAHPLSVSVPKSPHQGTIHKSHIELSRPFGLHSGHL